MPNALAKNGRAVARGTTAVFRSDAPCECCDQCPSWRELVQCDTGSIQCSPESPRHVWICTSVTCTNGEPITPNTVVFLDGHCFVAQNNTAPRPPEGAEYRPSLDPLQCVTACNQSPCPQGDLWYRAVPCAPQNEVIYVCGVTRCEIRGCYKVDPAVGGIPYSQIPAGATTVTINDLPQVSQTCCECDSTVCANIPLTTTIPPPDDPCYGAAYGRTCCCTTIVNNQGVRVTVGRLRSPEWSVHQEVRGGFGRTVTDVTIDPTSRQVDLNGCESFIVVSTQQSYDPGGAPVGDPVVVRGIRAGLGCEACGQWGLRAPRELIGPPYLPFQTITGDEGRSWGYACQGYFSPETGERLDVLNWSAQWDCTYMEQVASYRYTSTFSVTETTFRYRGVVVKPDGSQGDPCNDRCGGQILPGDAPQPARASSGCGGCGSGQKRTKV